MLLDAGARVSILNKDTVAKLQINANKGIPLALQAEIISELERMIAKGILEPIDVSEWVSNMVIVRMPSGSVKICCSLTEVR